MFKTVEITTTVNSYVSKGIVLQNIELYKNLANNMKEELSKIKVILMKIIEYGKVIGLYNMNLKYCLSCKRCKEELIYLIVPLNYIKQTFTLVVYLCSRNISGLTH